MKTWVGAVLAFVLALSAGGNAGAQYYSSCGYSYPSYSSYGYSYPSYSYYPSYRYSYASGCDSDERPARRMVTSASGIELQVLKEALVKQYVQSQLAQLPQSTLQAKLAQATQGSPPAQATQPAATQPALAPANPAPTQTVTLQLTAEELIRLRELLQTSLPPPVPQDK